MGAKELQYAADGQVDKLRHYLHAHPELIYTTYGSSHDTLLSTAVEHSQPRMQWKKSSKRSHLNTVRMLCEEFHCPLDVRVGTAQNTVLHIAVKEGSSDVLDYLLTLIADPMPMNVAGCTPLELAVRYKRSACVTLLQRACANWEEQEVEGNTASASATATASANMSAPPSSARAISAHPMHTVEPQSAHELDENTFRIRGPRAGIDPSLPNCFDSMRVTESDGKKSDCLPALNTECADVTRRASLATTTTTTTTTKPTANAETHRVVLPAYYTYNNDLTMPCANENSDSHINNDNNSKYSNNKDNNNLDSYHASGHKHKSSSNSYTSSRDHGQFCASHMHSLDVAAVAAAVREPQSQTTMQQPPRFTSAQQGQSGLLHEVSSTNCVDGTMHARALLDLFHAPPAATAASNVPTETGMHTNTNIFLGVDASGNYNDATHTVNDIYTTCSSGRHVEGSNITALTLARHEYDHFCCVFGNNFSFRPSGQAGNYVMCGHVPYTYKGVEYYTPVAITLVSRALQRRHESKRANLCCATSASMCATELKSSVAVANAFVMTNPSLATTHATTTSAASSVAIPGTHATSATAMHTDENVDIPYRVCIDFDNIGNFRIHRKAVYLDAVSGAFIPSPSDAEHMSLVSFVQHVVVKNFAAVPPLVSLGSMQAYPHPLPLNRIRDVLVRRVLSWNPQSSIEKSPLPMRTPNSLGSTSVQASDAARNLVATRLACCTEDDMNCNSNNSHRAKNTNMSRHCDSTNSNLLFGRNVNRLRQFRLIQELSRFADGWFEYQPSQHLVQGVVPLFHFHAPRERLCRELINPQKIAATAAATINNSNNNMNHNKCDGNTVSSHTTSANSNNNSHMPCSAGHTTVQMEGASAISSLRMIDVELLMCVRTELRFVPSMEPVLVSCGSSSAPESGPCLTNIKSSATGANTTDRSKNNYTTALRDHPSDGVGAVLSDRILINDRTPGASYVVYDDAPQIVLVDAATNSTLCECFGRVLRPQLRGTCVSSGEPPLCPTRSSVSGSGSAQINSGGGGFVGGNTSANHKSANRVQAPNMLWFTGNEGNSVSRHEAGSSYNSSTTTTAANISNSSADSSNALVTEWVVDPIWLSASMTDWAHTGSLFDILVALQDRLTLTLREYLENQVSLAVVAAVTAASPYTLPAAWTERGNGSSAQTKASSNNSNPAGPDAHASTDILDTLFGLQKSSDSARLQVTATIGQTQGVVGGENQNSRARESTGPLASSERADHSQLLSNAAAGSSARTCAVTKHVCLNCFAEPKNVLCYPCGHVVLCQTCAQRFMSHSCRGMCRCIVCHGVVTSLHELI